MAGTVKKTLCLIFSFFIILSIFSPINTYAVDISDLVDATKPVESSTTSGQAISNEAMERYVESGIFDKVSTTGGATNQSDKCSSVWASSGGNRNIIDFIASTPQCSEANDYYVSNTRYSQYAANGLRQYDKTDGRLNNAMSIFNERAHFVYNLLIGFGCLTSLLVFIWIFMRITWLPDNSFQRRHAMEDIVTSGIATIMLGGFWLVVGVFQSMFDRFWESRTVYTKDYTGAANIFLQEYRGLITGLLGVATLTALLMFIKSAASLALGVGASPQQRKNAIQQLLWCGIATVGLGAITVVASFFWNALR